MVSDLLQAIPTASIGGEDRLVSFVRVGNLRQRLRWRPVLGGRNFPESGICIEVALQAGYESFGTQENLVLQFFPRSRLILPFRRESRITWYRVAALRRKAERRRSVNAHNGASCRPAVAR
jgi:hypothetical protein